MYCIIRTCIERTMGAPCTLHGSFLWDSCVGGGPARLGRPTAHYVFTIFIFILSSHFSPPIYPFLSFLSLTSLCSWNHRPVGFPWRLPRYKRTNNVVPGPPLTHTVELRCCTAGASRPMASIRSHHCGFVYAGVITV